MDLGVTPAVAKTAGGAVLKVLGGMVSGAVREARRTRAVRRTVRNLTDRSPTEDVVGGLSEDEVSRLVAYVRLPDFEQLAIQLTGLTLERKRPEKYVDDLRAGLGRSLRLHGVVSVTTAEAAAAALLEELWSAVVLAIGEVGQSSHPADMPGIVVGVSMRAAAAARNCRLLERLESLDGVHSFTSAIRSQIGKVDGRMRPPNLTSGHRVPLARLYVEPRLEKYDPAATLQPSAGLSPKDVLSRHLRTVVLGNPGNGKSTLVTKLAVDLARSPQAKGIVPFLVVMRDFAQRFERDQLSVAHYLRVLASGRYQVETTEDCVEFLLLNGRGVVIFDGMDELLDTSLRRRVTEAVEAFACAYPMTSILATSRLVGYDQAPLDPALFTAYRLREFDDAQVEAYADKWFALDSTLPQETRAELATAFLREGEYVSDLRHNPLMLALMCALYRGEGYIPRNRLDVYERCSVLLFERWDRTRGIQVPLPFEQHVRPALWSLALSMFTAGDTRSAWSERELIASVRRFLLDRRFEDPDEAEAAARTFVEYCRGRAWVLNEVGTTNDGEPLFAFTHRTFLEFFAANQLVRTNPAPDQLLSTLSPHIHREEWDVVAQLAVLLLDRNVDGGADDFLDLLIRDAEGQPHRQRLPSLTFAARLLGYLVPAPQVRRRVVDACWEQAGTDDPLDEGKLAAALLLTAADENREPVAAMVRERAAAESHHGITALLAVTLDQLCGMASWSVDPRSFWYQESVDNRDLVRDALTELAPTLSWAATELVFSGEWSVAELVDRYGAHAVCESPLIWSTYRRAPLLQQEVLAGHDLDWRTWSPFVAVDPSAGTWADDLASTLPLTPTPWARLSRLPWWDMTVENPANSTRPGTSAFDVLVLCACLHWEARRVLRDAAEPAAAHSLPSWLRLEPGHPLNTVMRAPATDAVPGSWLSPVVRDLVDRWQAGEVRLVDDDLTVHSA